LELYPARLSGLFVKGTLEAENEDQLFDALATAFNSDKARETIGTLLAQAKG
jgi:hypothetical protein